MQDGSSREFFHVDPALGENGHSFEHHLLAFRRRKSDSEVSYIPTKDVSFEKEDISAIGDCDEASVSRYFPTNTYP